MKSVLCFFVSVFIFSSCVPRKSLIYLQGDPVSDNKIKKNNESPYKLQVNDIITIGIKSTDDDLVRLFLNSQVGANNNVMQSQGQSFFTGYSVDRNGNIRLPYLGEINVLGYTTKEVRLKLEDKLSVLYNSKDDYFVTVKLDGIRYTVIGEVSSPGPNVIYQNQVSIVDAITNSGDITLVGDRRNVEVIRFNSNNEVQKFVIDLTEIQSVNSDIFYIRPKDLINVKPLRQKSLGTGTTGIQTLTTIFTIFSVITSSILIVRAL